MPHNAAAGIVLKYHWQDGTSMLARLTELLGEPAALDKVLDYMIAVHGPVHRITDINDQVVPVTEETAEHIAAEILRKVAASGRAVIGYQSEVSCAAD